MTKLLIAISFLIFVGSPFVNAEQVYYCTAELATGFYKDKKTRKWGQANFQKERYTIKFNDDYTSLEGILDRNPWVCKKPYFGVMYEGALTCFDTNDNGDFFSFDRGTQVFVLMIGSVDGFLFPILKQETKLIAGDCKKF